MSQCGIIPTIVEGHSSLNWIDVSVVVSYFVLLFAITIIVYKRSSTSSTNYFLANRKSFWWAIGFSLLASNIGAEHLVGLSGSGASYGIPVGVFEWTAGFELLVLAFLFVPFYLSSKVYTMPEFLGKRYDQKCRFMYAVISLIASTCLKAAPTLYAGSLVLYDVWGWNTYVSAVSISLLSGLYVAVGGLTAVIYTEILQTSVIVAGAACVLYLGMARVGGLDGLYNCPALVPRPFFELLKPASDPYYPWTALLIAHPLTIGLWYWSSDQVIVQRVLSARNESHAQGGCVMAGFLKILPMFLFVFPGLVARALYYTQVLENSNNAYPLLVIDLLPTGLNGLMVAAMLALMMSSLASEFNSVGTLVAVDFYGQLHHNPSSSIGVLVGRISTIFVVLLALLWIPFIPLLSDELYTYMQKVQSAISGPVAAAFLLGVLWKRGNGHGAFASFCFGLPFGVARIVLEMVLSPSAVAGTLWVIFVNPTSTTPGLHYLHFALLSMGLCCIVLVCVSLLTAAPAPERIAGLTVWSRGAEDLALRYDELEKLPSPPSSSADVPDAVVRPPHVRRRVEMAVVIGVVVFVAVMLFLFIYFSTWQYADAAS